MVTPTGTDIEHTNLATKAIARAHHTTDFLQSTFANSVLDKQEIYPVTVVQIADAQRQSKAYKPYFAKNMDGKIKLDSKISLKKIDDEYVLVYEDRRLVIPTK